MKISAKKKLENRRAIIEAAVDQIIEKGFKGASMRAIARQAGVGDATIYNYFPTKEDIFYAYYEDRFQEAVDRLEAVGDLDEYSLQERLQALFEGLLESFLPDREFLQATFRTAFFSMPPNYKKLRPIQSHFTGAVSRSFEAARESGELQEHMFEDMVVLFFWDYLIGIVTYWLKDESEQFSSTTVLIDKTMELGCAVLKAGVVTKAFDICSFLFRNHVLSLLDNSRMGLDALDNLKSAFMEAGHGRKDSQR